MSSPEPKIGQRPEGWLLGEARAVRGELTATVAGGFGAALMMVLQARLLALSCQRLVVDRVPFSTLLPLVAGVVAAAVARGGLGLLSEQRAVAAAGRVKQRVRSRLFRRLQELAPAGAGGMDTGGLVEVVTSGVEGLEAYIGRFLPQLVLAGLLPLMALLLVLPVEWRSGLVLLFSAPFIPLFMVLIGRGSERLNRRQWSQLSRMAGHLLDLVQGLPDLKIFGAARRESRVVGRMAEQYRRGTMAVLRIAFLSAFTLEFFATVGTAVVAVVIGFRLLNGSLSLLDGLFVLLLAPEFYLPLRSLGLSYHSRMQGIAATELIVPLLDSSVAGGCSGALPAPATAPTLVFEGVSFRSRAGRGGLEGIDVELPAASLTALVGESGAGKSTLARLLTGLTRPDSGRITVDGIDLRRLDPESWRAGLAWVSQKPFFFPGTIRENLLLARPDAGEAEIRQALDDAAATGFIQRLADGIQSRIGDRGAGLSGGELRRLALARAFLRRALLVVLDEPTAGLDRENELLVAEAIKRLSVGRTVLVISHREETVRRAERVILLTAGRVERVVTPNKSGPAGVVTR
jgi:ATP-binding cassette subfamily C protein CydD